MRTLRILETRDRTLYICHAIRHLLDHAPRDASIGDIEAIDLCKASSAVLTQPYQARFPPRK